MKRALAISLLALGAASTPPVADPADVLREADRAFWEATREEGLEGWLSWFADDAVVILADDEDSFAVGSEQIRAHYTSLPDFPPPGFLWEPEEAGITAQGDLGWTRGRWGSDLGETPIWSGQYLSVWSQREDGSYAVASDYAFDEGYARRIANLTSAPVAMGWESAHEFRSSTGELSATLGTWWARDSLEAEARGQYLSVWRREPDGTHVLVAQTGAAAR